MECSEGPCNPLLLLAITRRHARMLPPFLVSAKLLRLLLLLCLMATLLLLLPLLMLLLLLLLLLPLPYVLRVLRLVLLAVGTRHSLLQGLVREELRVCSGEASDECTWLCEWK